MNDYSSAFHLISEITSQKAIACILIGGYAVNFHKYTRQTQDLDFMMVKEDFDRIVTALQKAGYNQLETQENFAQFKSSHPALLDIDFMFVDQSTLEKILKDAKQVKIKDHSFFIPSVEHLIALKLHSMKGNYKIRWTKDFPDVISLIRANKINIQADQFKAMCLKFGTPELYQLIKENA